MSGTESRSLVKGIFGISRTSEIPDLIPGLLLAAGLMLAGTWVADYAGRWFLTLAGIEPAGKASPVSSVLVAIILGIAVRNTLGLSDRFANGVRFTVNKVLRLGIILVGIKLSVVDVL